MALALSLSLSRSAGITDRRDVLQWYMEGALWYKAGKISLTQSSKSTCFTNVVNPS